MWIFDSLDIQLGNLSFQSLKDSNELLKAQKNLWLLATQNKDNKEFK